MYKLVLILLCLSILLGVVPRLNAMSLKDLKCVYPIFYASGLISIAAGAAGSALSAILGDYSFVHEAYILLIAGIAELLFASRIRPKMPRRKNTCQL
jgi:hypothetical protein